MYIRHICTGNIHIMIIMINQIHTHGEKGKEIAREKLIMDREIFYDIFDDDVPSTQVYTI